MSKRSTRHEAAEQHVKSIRRATRKQYSAEEKSRVVLEGLRGEQSIAELCRREGIAQSLYYSWSKEFLEAGKKRLSGDPAREATSDEVRSLRREAWFRGLAADVRFPKPVDNLFGVVSFRRHGSDLLFPSLSSLQIRTRNSGQGH